MKTRILSMTTKAMVAVALITTAALAPQSASAQPGSVMAGSALVAQQTGILDEIRGLESELFEIPYFGDAVVGPLLDALETLPVKHTPTNNEDFLSDWPYLEFTHGDAAVTIFDIGSYGGFPRIIVAFTYDGILSTDEGWSTDGVWGFLPGAVLEYPTVIYRPSSGIFAAATPVVSGSNLPLLPGQLGVVADKAAKITRTLRIPLGALALAGFQPSGLLATAFELYNLPTDSVYVMAGSGLDSFPPGGTISGQNVDPMVQSWRNQRSFARADAGENQGEDFVQFKRMLPSAAGYLKISVAGRWNNPMTLFDFQSYATDAVLMFTYSGDVSSWGEINNPFGEGESFVYAIDIPGILMGNEASIPDMSFGLSFDELGLGDAVKKKVGIMTNLSSIEFLRKLNVLAGATSAPANQLGALFDGTTETVTQIRDIVGNAVDTLPLNEVKITNPVYVPYDRVTHTYPPSESFAIYFSASDGITATGERGPILVTNGDFRFLGQTLASTKAILSLKKGLEWRTSVGGSVHLGTVLGADLNIEGTDSTVVVANTSHVLMQSRKTLNLLGISKGEALMQFKLDNSAPKMRFVFDPTGGCMPPVPLKVDMTVSMPTSLGSLQNEVLNLVKGAQADAGGLVNCGGFIYELGSQGAGYVGEGVIIGGSYVAEGTNYVAAYGSQGVSYAADYSTKGANQVASTATDAYRELTNGIDTGVGVLADFGGNAWGSIKDFGNKIGCGLGLGGCGGGSTPDMPTMSRVDSPFTCPQGQFYSLEFGRCLQTGSSLYAYTGGNTDGPQCIRAIGDNNGAAKLNPCVSSNWQVLFPSPVQPEALAIAGPNRNACLTTADGTFAAGKSLVFGDCGAAPGLDLDAEGRLVARVGQDSLCVRPDTPLSHPIAFGPMADWKSLGGGMRDITVDTEGRMYGIDTSGDVYEAQGPDLWAGISLGSGLLRLDVVDKVFWGVTASGAALRFTDGWQDTGGDLSDVGVGGPEGDIVYGVGNGSVYRWDENSGWASVAGSGVRIDVDGTGTAWVVRQDGTVSHSNGDWEDWENLPQVPGGAADISAGRSGTVIVSTTLGEIYVLSGGSWQRFPGMAKDIAVGPDGSPWVTVDVGDKHGTVFVHNSSTSAADWTGLAQPSAFAQGSQVGKQSEQLILDRCDPAPVTTAWTAIQPKVSTDLAAQAGLNGSFRLEHEEAPPGGRLVPLGYNWALLTDSTGTMLEAMPPKYQARSEFSAVFAAPDTFALYHHVTGMCVEDEGSMFPWLKKCTFAPEQLWRRTDLGNGRFLVENVSRAGTGTSTATRYLAPDAVDNWIRMNGTPGMVAAGSIQADRLQGWLFTPAHTKPVVATVDTITVVGWVSQNLQAQLDLAPIVQGLRGDDGAVRTAIVDYFWQHRGPGAVQYLGVCDRTGEWPYSYPELADAPFDPCYYASFGKPARVMTSNVMDSLVDWLDMGIDDGRTPPTVNYWPNQYRARYPWVTEEFGSNPRRIFQYFFEYGKALGHDGGPPPKHPKLTEYQSETYGWKTLDVSVGGDGSVWKLEEVQVEVLGSRGYSLARRGMAMRFHGAGWDSLEVGIGERLAVDPTGLPWILGYDNTLRRYDWDTDALVDVPSAQLTDVGIGADGTVWGVGTDGSVLRRQAPADQHGDTWDDMGFPGPARCIDVDPHGNAWVTGEATLYSRLWRYDSGSWTEVAGLENAHSGLGSFTEVGIGPDGSVWTAHIENAGWYSHRLFDQPDVVTEFIQESAVFRLSADLDGNPLVLFGSGPAGQLMRYDRAESGPPSLAADLLPPRITLKGRDDVNHRFGTTYVDSGATARDLVDGVLPVTTNGTVQGTVLGDYMITYTATDAAGNTTQATRLVAVREDAFGAPAPGPAPDPVADVESGYYTLQAYDGRPVTEQSDGTLIAGGGSGTRFYVHNRGNGEYAIQGNSTWLNADANGLRSSAPNGDYAEQHFRLEDLGDGTVGIKTMPGIIANSEAPKWLFTDENYGGQLSLNTSQIHDWWPFTLVPADSPEPGPAPDPLTIVDSGHYILQAYDGRPVTVQSDGKLFAGGGSGTRFYVHNRGNGEYAIQGNSTWLNADANGLRSSAPNGDYAQQHFRLEDLGDGTVAIQTSAGEWLFTDENWGGLLSFNTSQIHDWWPFALVPADSPDSAVSWVRIEGLGIDIGAGADGTVWGVGTDGTVWRYTDPSWEYMNLSGALRVDVDPQGSAWVVLENGEMRHFDGSAWQVIPGNSRDIGVGADGTVWGVGTDGRVYRHGPGAPGDWQDMEGIETARIDVDPHGVAWTVQDNGRIWRSDGTPGGWIPVPGAEGQDIGVGGDGSVWIAEASGRVSRWNEVNGS
jgi:virginiamycin B lyase